MIKQKQLRWMVLVVFLGIAPGWAATNEFRALLQKGLFEEEANRDYKAAIEAYEGIASQAEEQRKIMATALFRLGECYRKSGKTNEAAASYERLLREFPEQSELGASSRQQLAKVGGSATLTGAGAPTGTTNGLDEEAKEIVRLQRLAKDSPDLLYGAPGTTPPLLIAILNGQARVVDFLLDAGISPNTTGQESALGLAAGNGKQALVELLVAKGADVNLRGPRGPALVRAAGGGYRSIVNFLLDHKADINARDPSGQTALHLTAASGFPAVVNLLLDRGADVNATDSKGNSALVTAVESWRPAVVKILVERKADLNAPNKAGGSPLAIAVKQQNEEMLKLLLDGGANVNSTNVDGRTPLSVAAELRATNIVATLLERGAEVNARNTDGWTPLFFALLIAGNLPTADLLFQYKADVNAKTKDGRSALFWAIESSDETIVRQRMPAMGWLLAHGADPNVVDERGRTALSLLRGPLQLTSGVRVQDIQNLLYQYGAKHFIPSAKFIQAVRPEISAPIFVRGTNPYNSYTLFEAIAALYELEQRDFVFPELRKVAIHHLNGTKTNIDLLGIVQSKDCQSDRELEWGDALEIAEANHLAGLVWDGLPANVAGFLTNCLARKVDIIVQGVVKPVYLKLTIWNLNSPAGTAVPGRPRLAGLRLDPVVKNSRVLRASSDLKRVKVTRNDRSGGKSEMVFDLTATDPANDLLLRDGDVIEIPDKE